MSFPSAARACGPACGEHSPSQWVTGGSCKRADRPHPAKHRCAPVPPCRIVQCRSCSYSVETRPVQPRQSSGPRLKAVLDRGSARQWDVFCTAFEINLYRRCTYQAATGGCAGRTARGAVAIHGACDAKAGRDESLKRRRPLPVGRARSASLCPASAGSRVQWDSRTSRRTASKSNRGAPAVGLPDGVRDVRFSRRTRGDPRRADHRRTSDVFVCARPAPGPAPEGPGQPAF